MGLSPMQTPEGPLSWNAASVDLPPIPMIAPGADAMSMTIASVLPTLTVPLTASVAALSAKENMFSGKVTSADLAYQNSDQSGGQSVGQLGQMLGQLDQMVQQASGPAQALSGQSGMFGSMMQQAMQGGGGDARGGGASAGAAPQTRDDDSSGERDRTRDDAHDDDRREERRRLDSALAGPAPHANGPVPVAPPEHPRDGGDLSRRT